MKALAATRHGDFQTVLSLQDVPLQHQQQQQKDLQPNQVLVQVAWSEVNPVDLQKLKGRPGQAVNGYFIPGFAGSGVVVQQGSQQDEKNDNDDDDEAMQLPRWEEGTKVAFLVDPSSTSGSYAEYCVVDCRAIAAVLEKVSLRDAASVPLTGCTAYEALRKVELGPKQSSTNKKKKSLLIVGGSGGVGSWATRLARAWYPVDELEIIVTTSSQESTKWCQEQGASRCIGHDEIEGSLKGGLQGSIDSIVCLTEPTPTVMKAMAEVLRPYGHICLVVAGASINSLDLGFLFFKSAHIAFETVFSCFRSKFSSAIPGNEIRDILELLPSIGAPLSPLLKDIDEDWRQATVQGGILAALQGGHSRGKLVMKVGGTS